MSKTEDKVKRDCKCRLMHRLCPSNLTYLIVRCGETILLLHNQNPRVKSKEVLLHNLLGQLIRKLQLILGAKGY
jgi:hypothetical protein